MLEPVLQNLTRHSRKHMILLGDFNVDLIKYENDLTCQNLIDTMSNFGFVQHQAYPFY